MLIKVYKNKFKTELLNWYDEGEIESFFYLILEHKHQLRRIDLALNINLTFNDTDLKYWHAVLEELKTEKPIQYILGTTSFFGLNFWVDYNVLIPRPETEELVDWIIKNNLKNRNLKILDIGTGSGCIAISLAKNLADSQVFAIDIDDDALAIAEKNAKKNNVNINFITQNILETNDLKTKFDLIVSNPPYVRILEKKEIQNNVLKNEPHKALFVEDNSPLVFYEKIAALAQKNLSENGQLYFEINQYLGDEMLVLMQKFDFKNITLRQDIYGNDRMLFGLK